MSDKPRHADASTNRPICPVCNSSRWCGRACQHRLNEIAAKPGGALDPRTRRTNHKRKPPK